MTTPAIITPALGLKFFTDSEISVFANGRILNLTENASSFPNLSPTVSGLANITSQYDNVLKMCGVDASRSITSAKNVKRRELERTLTLCAFSCAQIADNDEARYLLSGFNYKSKGARTTELDSPDNVRYRQAPFDGSVYLLFKRVKNAGSYEINMRENNNDTWSIITSAAASPVLITDLKQLSIYFVRCRAIGARNIKSPWSSTVQIKVM